MKSKVMGLLIITMLMILVIEIACLVEIKAAMLLCIPEIMLCIISMFIQNNFDE